MIFLLKRVISATIQYIELKHFSILLHIHKRAHISIILLVKLFYVINHLYYITAQLLCLDNFLSAFPTAEAKKKLSHKTNAIKRKNNTICMSVYITNTFGLIKQIFKAVNPIEFGSIFVSMIFLLCCVYQMPTNFMQKTHKTYYVFAKFEL